MKKYIYLLSSVGLRQSILTISGNAFGTSFSALALIIFSRILGPEKFGEFSVGFALVMILIRFNDLGLNTAILKFGSSLTDVSEKNQVFSITLKYKLIISVGLMALGVLSYSYLSDLLNFDNSLIILMSFTVGLTTVYYEQLLNTLQSLHLFGRAVLINAIQAMVKLIVALIMLSLYLHSSSIAFFWYVIAPLTPVFLWSWLLPKNVVFSSQQVSDVVKNKVIQLAKHSSVGLLSAGIIENIDILFLQKYLTTYETGLYSGVSRIALLFALVAYSLGNVLYPRVAKYKTRRDLVSFYKKSIMLTLLCVGGFLLILPFISPLIYYSVGSDYISGSHLMVLLLASSFLAIGSIPFIATFFSYEANWYFSISGILQLLVVIVGNIILVPIMGLEGAAYTKLFTRLVLFIFTVVTSFVLFRKNYAPIVSDN